MTDKKDDVICGEDGESIDFCTDSESFFHEWRPLKGYQRFPNARQCVNCLFTDWGKSE